jgi:hypothetical protein
MRWFWFITTQAQGKITTAIKIWHKDQFIVPSSGGKGLQTPAKAVPKNGFVGMANPFFG